MTLFKAQCIVLCVDIVYEVKRVTIRDPAYMSLNLNILYDVVIQQQVFRRNHEVNIHSFCIIWSPVERCVICNNTTSSFLDFTLDLFLFNMTILNQFYQICDFALLKSATIK